MEARKRRRGHGEGSVYQRRSDGKWCAAVRLPGGGKKVVYGATEREAIRARDRIKASLSRGVLPDSITLGDWLDHWLDVIAPGEMKLTTIDRHRSYVETWIKPTIGAVRLQEVQVDHVRLLMRRMAQHTSARTGRPLTERTIAKARAVLQAGLTQAVNDGRLLWNPAARAKPPKMKADPDLRRLTADEARRVIDACTEPRGRARLAVALMAGLRQGEALALRWEHVHLEADGSGGVIEVRWSASRVRGHGMVEDTPKTLRSVRDVRIGPAAAQMLAAWRAMSGSGHVFGHRFDGPERVEDSRRDYEEWRQALVVAGVPHVRLHDARGTAESHMAAVVQPWVAAEMLGHGEDVARRAYMRASPDQQIEAARAVDGFGG